MLALCLLQRRFAFHVYVSSLGPRANLILQFLNSSDRMSPWPVSSTLKISIVCDCGRRDILQTPSSLIVSLSPATH